MRSRSDGTARRAKRATDPLVIVDDRYFLHRFQATHPHAAFGIEEPWEVRPFVEPFAAIWTSAELGIGATVLGL